MKKAVVPNKDAVIKTALEELFPDFLRFVFKDADEVFDFSEKIVFLDKELDKIDQQSNKGGGRVLDKLARVKLKLGGYEHVLVLVEAEGGGKSEFAERMFVHYYRVRDKFGGRICSIALLTDRNPNYYPTKFIEECLGTEVHFRFNAIKIWGLNRAELENNENPFAVAALTILAELERGYSPAEKLIELGKSIALNLQKRKIPLLIRRALLVFLYYYINFDNPEIEAKFEMELNRITSKNNSMAVIVGYREMIELEIAEKMLQGGVPIKDVCTYTSLPFIEVKKLAKKLKIQVELN